MKRLIYIFTAIFLVFTSCQHETLLEAVQEDPSVQGETQSIQFGLDIPQFAVMTKSNGFETEDAEIKTIELYTFDANGIFLGKATNVTDPDANKKGTAILSTKTRIIHFVINSTDTQTFTPDGKLTEVDIMPALETTQLGYWGRKEVTLAELQSLVTVELIRNYAKISFKEKENDIYKGVTFAIANNPKSAKVAVFDEDGNDTFAPVEDVLTLPDNLDFWKYGHDNTELEEDGLKGVQFLYETENATLQQEGTPTFVIAKIGNEFHKFQLILSAVEACKIERNYHYEIVFEDFKLNTEGYATFEAAVAGEVVANDIFAEIIKHSPGIMDSKNNKIEVGKLAYQMVAGNTIEIPATYFNNGVPNHEDIKCYVKDGGEAFITAEYITPDNPGEQGTIRVVALAGANGNDAVVVFADSNELLKREIKISVTEGFEFTTFVIDPDPNGEDVILTIGLPAGLDRAYFPLQLKIRANNIAPTQGLIIGHGEGGSIPYYLYEVTEDLYDFESDQPTNIMIPFKVSLSKVEEVSVEHENFVTKTADFEPVYRMVTFDGTFSYFLYGFEFGVTDKNETVSLTYDGAEETQEISIANGKAEGIFFLPGKKEMTLASTLYPFMTKTLYADDLANDIRLTNDFVSTSELTKEISIAAKLRYYRMDNKANAELGSGDEFFLNYLTKEGTVKERMLYKQTTTVTIPDDVDLVVLSRIVSKTRVYKVIVSVDELEQEGNEITLVHNPAYNAEL